MGKTAFITGITGQDGYYLSNLLLEKGYTVHGLYRRSSTANNTVRIQAMLEAEQIVLHHGDISDGLALAHILKRIQPDEIYNLAAMSDVALSFENPIYTGQIDALGTLNLLEAVRLLDKPVRFYQASSSEIYGNSKEERQSETTPFEPCSPYASAKLYAYWITRNYREAYDMFACNGILFNHESPLRGPEFVTRKITMAAARIKHGRQECLYLGNLDAQRDWGHARDYVRAMWLMLRHDRAEDCVIATGQKTPVRDFATRAFACAGMVLDWDGQGKSEKAIDRKTGRTVIAVDPKLYRHRDVNVLCGDASKARMLLGWAPETTLDDLIAEMVKADLANCHPERNEESSF